MKKLLMFLLVCLMILPLTACGGNDSTSKNNGDVKVESNDSNDSNDSNESNEEKEEIVKEPTTKEESIVCDNEYALIRLESVTMSKDSLVADVYLENKTKDKSLSIYTWTASVNGIQIDSMYGEELEPASNKTGKVTIPTSYLQMCNIEEFTDISLTFVVYDLENMSDEHLVKGSVHFYPYGKDKAEKFVLPDDPSYNVLMNQDNIKVSCLGFEEDPTYGSFAMLYIENNTDRTYTVSVDESTVDKVGADLFAYVEVEAGNVGFVELLWSGDPIVEYDENGEPIESDQEVPEIATAEDIKIALCVYDTDDWEAPSLFYETVDLR